MVYKYVHTVLNLLLTYFQSVYFYIYMDSDIKFPIFYTALFSFSNQVKNWPHKMSLDFLFPLLLSRRHHKVGINSSLNLQLLFAFCFLVEYAN